MHSTDDIARLFHQHGGILRRAILTQSGIHGGTLKRLMADGLIQKVRTGYYEWTADGGTDEMTLVQKFFPEGIFCMDSALYLYEYTDRIPRSWHLAVPYEASRTKYKLAYPKVKPYFRNAQSLAIGLTCKRVNGAVVPVYDRERTICDCIARRNRMDKECFVKAIRAYCEDSKRDIATLMWYARQLNVETPTKGIIGLWQ